jgi:hypothetical protein
MKAFLSAVVAVIVIALSAGAVLNRDAESAAAAFSTQGVRLDAADSHR